jgi:GT2 family glycosyltransferase
MLSSLLRKMERPVFSIVVPTYNRPHQLAGLLRALASIDYPLEQFDVIVVDDGGRISLEPVVAPFESQINLSLLKQPNGGAASARQTGVERAQGFYVAFTDDDCQPAPNWLRSLESSLTATPGCAVGGRTINGLTDNVYSSATQTLENYLRAQWNTESAGTGFFGTANLAMPLDLFRSIGGFDVQHWPHGGEDRDLCARWIEHGYSLVYAPDAVVHHLHNLNFFSFPRQHFGYGRGAYRVRLASAQRRQRGIKVEPLAFYSRLLVFGLTETRGMRALSTPILLACAQVFNAAGFVWEWSRQRTPRESPAHADLHHRL